MPRTRCGYMTEQEFRSLLWDLTFHFMDYMSYYVHSLVPEHCNSQMERFAASGVMDD